MNSKNVLITGTSKGIGRALTKELLQKGFFVIGICRNNSNLQHQNYIEFNIDVTDEDAIDQIFYELNFRGIDVDILVNNAGIASMNHFTLMDINTVNKIIKTNFISVVKITQLTVKMMMKKKSGLIINISTVAVPLEIEGEAVYAASKAAVETFSKIISKELNGLNIKIKCLRLPPLETDLIKNVDKNKIEKINSILGIQEKVQISELINNLVYKISNNFETEDEEIVKLYYGY